MVAKKIFSEFQSTLPRGSDALCVVNFGDPLISIHAPSRERQKETPATADYANISIHAPSRERPTARSRVAANPLYFNPRSLAGATCEGNGLSHSSGFQSTLPRGSDRRPGIGADWFAISIHAPSRERRVPGHKTKMYLNISIHAPSRERLRRLLLSIVKGSFQSTLPRGSDLTASYQHKQ